MDAAGSLKPDFTKYNLVNNETGKVEETDLLYVVAKDKQNILWSRGIKTALAKVASRIAMVDMVAREKELAAQSNQFAGWYEGYHARDEEIEQLKTEIESLKLTLVELNANKKLLLALQKQVDGDPDTAY